MKIIIIANSVIHFWSVIKKNQNKVPRISWKEKFVKQRKTGYIWTKAVVQIQVCSFYDFFFLIFKHICRIPNIKDWMDIEKKEIIQIITAQPPSPPPSSNCWIFFPRILLLLSSLNKEEMNKFFVVVVVDDGGGSGWTVWCTGEEMLFRVLDIMATFVLLLVCVCVCTLVFFVFFSHSCCKMNFFALWIMVFIIFADTLLLRTHFEWDFYSFYVYKSSGRLFHDYYTWFRLGECEFCLFLSSSSSNTIYEFVAMAIKFFFFGE